MTIDRPAISVLVPVRDAADTIDECLDSISAQTFDDFEVLVLDDGSIDETPERVAARVRRDPRIRLHLLGRVGLVAALNAGLRAIRSPVVARMDADDWMHRERLGRQLAFLSREPDVDLVASRVRVVSVEPLRAGMREYLRWQDGCLSPGEIGDQIYVESPLVHPTVTYRARVVRRLGGYFDGDFPEDYELWLRLHRAGRRMAKLAQPLLDWRLHSRSLWRTDPRYARSAFDRLRAHYLSRDRRLLQGRPVVIWGAGRRTRRRCDPLLARGLRPSAWVDVDPRKVGRTLAGVPVVGPRWLDATSRGRARPFVLVYVASHGARGAITARLDAMGYEQGADYLAVG